MTQEDLLQIIKQGETEAFYLTNDIEKYGSGFMRIRKEISNYPTMKFNYKEVGNVFFC